jgi:hypothetical protein
VWYETHDSVAAAIRRAKRLKKWPRAWKVALIERANPECGTCGSRSPDGPGKRGRTVLLHAASAIILVGSVAGVAHGGQEEALLQAGSYEVKVRLELPNVVNWAASRTTTICIPYVGRLSNAPLPVLSDNNPLAKCPARNVQRTGATLSFDIVCAGRNAARARAVYTLMPQEFRGRIAMVMGGKNMTMTEEQRGRRVGGCDLAGAPPS